MYDSIRESGSPAKGVNILFFFCSTAGPNLIFFNERARGLPSGIVLGQTSRPCVTLDADLRAAKLHYHLDLTPQIINKIEVIIIYLLILRVLHMQMLTRAWYEHHCSSFDILEILRVSEKLRAYPSLNATLTNFLD